MQKQKSMRISVVHAHAAGVDVGSRSHFVAVGQGKDDVREFGIYDKDLRACAGWMKSYGITTVAMESTGSYWQNLYDVLTESGFEVLLVNGAHTRHMKGHKTDVQDCQWIQYLHSVGLLTGSFLPDIDTEELRTLYRHRDFLRKQAAGYISKMQKCLRLMNFRLDTVLNDVTGVSGQAIIKADFIGRNPPRNAGCSGQQPREKVKGGNCLIVELQRADRLSVRVGRLFQDVSCLS
jgi:hypothetical protein